MLSASTAALLSTRRCLLTAGCPTGVGPSRSSSRIRRRAGSPGASNTASADWLLWLEQARRLADLDQVTIRVADVGADLAAVVLGLGQELGALRRPLRVGRADVGDPEVEKCAGLVGVSRRRERHRGLVIGRAAARIKDEPAVGDLHDDRVAFHHHLRSEHRAVKLTGPVLVRDHQEVSDHEPALGGREVAIAHLATLSTRRALSAEIAVAAVSRLRPSRQRAPLTAHPHAARDVSAETSRAPESRREVILAVMPTLAVIGAGPKGIAI